MRAFVVSNHEQISDRVQQVLIREGHECLSAHLVRYHQAADHLAKADPEVLVMVLSPDPAGGLALLEHLGNAAKAPVLMVGPMADSRLILQAVRGGVSDYVNEADLESELPAALRRLRTEAAVQAQPGRTIALLAPSGGSGSSTLAVNMATVLAKEHKSALLVDLKLQSGDLAALMDLRPTHTLAELCQNAERMDRVMFERSLVVHSSGVRLLAPARSLADVVYVSAEGVKQAMRLARNLFPYVVVDLDHTFLDEQIQALREADVILLILRLDFTSLRNGQRGIEHLARLDIDRERIRIVVNRFGQPKEVPAAKAEEALGMRIFHYVPDDSKTINRANNIGVPAVLESPSAKVCRSLTQLVTSVNGRHEKR